MWWVEATPHKSITPLVLMHRLANNLTHRNKIIMMVDQPEYCLIYVVSTLA
jgi:hypothetical protein